jgi:hypothetical protein
VFLEVTDYLRAFDAVTCVSCGHTSFFVADLADLPRGKRVVAPPDAGGPYR